MRGFRRHRFAATFSIALLLVTVFGLRAEASRTGAARGAAGVSTVNVTVGTPTELAVTFSKFALIPPGAVVFKITNAGSVGHTFTVCTTPTAGALPNTCPGKMVTLATTGLSGTLKLTLKQGKYEYLSTADGQAVAGTKGMIGIGLTVSKKTVKIPKGATVGTSAPTTTKPKGSTTPSSTTTTPASNLPPGNASNGAAVFASSGCGSCHTLAAAGTTGTAGPNLNQAKPALALIQFRVKNGGLDMPPFGGQLTDQQIADVAAYVYQSTH